MAWTTPRTWNAGETVTSAIMNAHIRDQLNVLKTNIDDSGYPRTHLAGFAFSSGEGNDVGGGDTQLTGYDVTIPAGFLAEPGDAIVVEGAWSAANNANAKTGKLQVGAGTTFVITATGAALAGHIIPFRVVIRRRGATTGAGAGLYFKDAAATAEPTPILINAGLSSFDWSIAQTLKIFAASADADDLLLTDYEVWHRRGYGASV